MKRKHWMDKMIQALDLGYESMPGKPLVEIIHNQSVLVENHCGVISYSTEAVCIKTRCGYIVIAGEGLTLHKMSCEQLWIRGCIHKVELSGRR